MATAVHGEALGGFFEDDRPRLEVIEGGLGSVATETMVEGEFANHPLTGTSYEVGYDDHGNIISSQVTTPGVGTTRVSYDAKGNALTTTVTDYVANTLATTYHQKDGDVTISDVYRGGASSGWVSDLPANAYK